MRASMDCHYRELVLGVKLAVHLNYAKLAKAKAHHATTTAALQKAHLDSITTLNHEATAEEGQKC